LRLGEAEAPWALECLFFEFISTVSQGGSQDEVLGIGVIGT